MTDYIREIYQQSIAKVIKKRDDEILKLLEERINLPDDPKEREHFFRTRCERHVFPNKLNQLLVDGVLITEWYDRIKFEESNEGRSQSVSVTLG